MPDTIVPKATNIFQRVFCVTISPPPADAQSWETDGNELRVDLSRLPELLPAGRSVRLEDERLPDRVLLVHADDGTYHAFRNRCACGGFRIDPVPGRDRIRCCTPMASTYDFTGKPTGSHPPRNVDVLNASLSNDVLTVDISPLHEPAPHQRT
jgi:hypothetical protein